jgi:hypothetical protein
MTGPIEEIRGTCVVVTEALFCRCGATAKKSFRETATGASRDFKDNVDCFGGRTPSPNRETTARRTIGLR